MSGSQDERLQWLKRVLGVEVGATGSTLNEEDDPLDLKNRIATATKQLDELRSGADSADLGELVGAHAAASRAVETKSVNAGEMMDLLERQLSRARQEARFRKESGELSGKVAYAQLLLRWHKAQSDVLDRIETLSDVLRHHPDLEQDEDKDEVLDLIDDLPTLIPEFGAELDDILDDARKPGADLESLHEDARAVLKRYRTELARMSVLQDLEDLAQNAGAGSVALYRELESALDELDGELSKAA